MNQSSIEVHILVTLAVTHSPSDEEYSSALMTEVNEPRLPEIVR